MTDLNSAILIIAVVANTVLATLVWRTSKHNTSARLFLVTVGLIIAWTIANYEIDTSNTGAEALFWTRMLFSFALAYIYLFYVFALTFAQTKQIRLTSFSLLVSVATFAAIGATLSSNLVFSDAILGRAGLRDLSFGPLYLFLSIFGLVIAGLGIAELAKIAHRAGRTIIRDQAVLIIIGWFTFLSLVIIFAAILPYFIPALINISKIEPLFSIVMVGCSTYAMVRHRFLDVTAFIRRGLVYSLLLGTILSLYLIGLFILAYLFRIDSDALEFLVGSSTVVIGIFGAPHIEAYFRKLTDRFFFKDTYEYSTALEELSIILNTTVRIPQLVGRSLHVLKRILKSDRIEFLYLKTGKRYDMSGNYGLAFESSLPGEDGLVVPIASERGPLGEFLFWPKRSGDPYTKEDRALLRTFASQATIALEKAELYEQLKEYSDQLEEKVRDRTRHLEDLRSSQREFMDDISHALQTPLTILTSTIEAVTRNLPIEQSKQADRVNHCIDELSRLIKNLLALARVEALPETNESTRFNLSEMLGNILEYVSVVCAGNDIVLSGDVTPDLYIRGNQTQIEEAITNILSNAVRYTADCPVRSIHVHLKLDGLDRTITIQDTGIGISEERLPHIFERFYRAQDAKGSGIGLAITKRIIERHSGRIETTSTFGTGTTIVVRLPAPD